MSTNPISITEHGLLTVAPVTPSPRLLALDLLEAGAYLNRPEDHPGDGSAAFHRIPAERLRHALDTFQAISDDLYDFGCSDLKTRLDPSTPDPWLPLDMEILAERGPQQDWWHPMVDQHEGPDPTIDPTPGLNLIRTIAKASSVLYAYGRIPADWHTSIPAVLHSNT